MANELAPGADAKVVDTPRTDALTKRMASELGRPMLEADHLIELCDHARQLERELAAQEVQMNAVRYRAERAEAACAWIPVSERLPEDGQVVDTIMIDGNRYTDIKYLGGESRWTWGEVDEEGHSTPAGEATHWMPIPPTPPQENKT